MDLFFVLVGKILPLYGLMLIGFVAGRLTKVQPDSVARLLLYILSPMIVFHGVYTTSIDTSTLVLPLFFFVLACSMSLAAYTLGRFVWNDNTRNIFAYASATGNTGYFGIPVALALMGESALGTVVLCTMGLIFFENSLGFFLTARGSFSPKQSLRKLIALPSIYALLLGLLLHALSIDLPASYTTFIGNVRGAYTVLGSMMIGLGVSSLRRWTVDWKFLSLCFVTKFLATPLATLTFIAADQAWWGLFSPTMQQVAILLSLMPLAANTVVLATALSVQPGKAALAVVGSTILALLIIPAGLSFLL